LDQQPIIHARWAVNLEEQESVVICRQFCSAFQLVELDQDAGERSGAIRADPENPGERIGAYDVFIAGFASARGHVLATHNVREFGRVAGIQTEGWAAIP
jgi:tRNA(fMet)-specific endonuclease VapC